MLEGKPGKNFQEKLAGFRHKGFGSVDTLKEKDI